MLEMLVRRVHAFSISNLIDKNISIISKCASTAHAPSLTLKNQYILDSTTPHKQETFDILPDFTGSSKP